MPRSAKKDIVSAKQNALTLGNLGKSIFVLPLVLFRFWCNRKNKHPPTPTAKTNTARTDGVLSFCCPFGLMVWGLGALGFRVWESGRRACSRIRTPHKQPQFSSSCSSKEVAVVVVKNTTRAALRPVDGPEEAEQSAKRLYFYGPPSTGPPECEGLYRFEL